MVDNDNAGGGVEQSQVVRSSGWSFQKKLLIVGLVVGVIIFVAVIVMGVAGWFSLWKVFGFFVGAGLLVGIIVLGWYVWRLRAGGDLRGSSYVSRNEAKKIAVSLLLDEYAEHVSDVIFDEVRHKGKGNTPIYHLQAYGDLSHEKFDVLVSQVDTSKQVVLRNASSFQLDCRMEELAENPSSDVRTREIRDQFGRVVETITERNDAGSGEGEF